MLAAIIATVLVGSVFGTKSQLTIYSTNQRCMVQNYPQYPYSTHGELAAVPYGCHVPDIHIAGMDAMFYEFMPTLRNIYDRPFILVSRSQSDSNQMSACLVKDGLVSLAENYCARHVQQALQARKEKKAFLFYPHAFDIRRLYPAKSMKISKFEIPRDIKLKNLVNLFSYGMPYLFVQDAAVFDNSVMTWGLVEIAELDASMRPMKSVNYPTAAYRLGKMIHRESSEESHGSSSEESSKRPHYQYSTSTSQRPHHQYSTSTSRRPHHQYSTSTSQRPHHQYSTSTFSSSSEESSEHTRYPWQTSSTTRRSFNI